MKKNDIITKLQTIAASMREELNKNDGSTLQTISNTIKGSYESVRTYIAESERTKKALTTAKQYLDEAGKAIKKGDCKFSAKALDTLDNFLKEHKDKEAAAKKKAPAKKAATKTQTAKKSASTPIAAKRSSGKTGGVKKEPAQPTAMKSPDKTSLTSKTAAKN